MSESLHPRLPLETNLRRVPSSTPFSRTHSTTQSSNPRIKILVSTLSPPKTRTYSYQSDAYRSTSHVSVSVSASVVPPPTYSLRHALVIHALVIHALFLFIPGRSEWYVMVERVTCGWLRSFKGRCLGRYWGIFKSELEFGLERSCLGSGLG